MNILFICTSNKDRSPTLEKLFKEKYPYNKYRSAGINKYFCNKHNTNYIEHKDIDWADVVIFCESIHLQRCPYTLKPAQSVIVLNAGEYRKENKELYLSNAEKIINEHLKLVHY